MFLRRTFARNGPAVRDYVKVAVPATSANVGPGFDILGMAVNVWNVLEVERQDKFEMDIVGYGSDVLPRDETNLVMTGFKKAFDYAGMEVPPCKFTLHNRIPYARGMGSSSAAAIGGLVAGFVVAGVDAPAAGGMETLLQLGADIEGHADNAAPCLYGGLNLGYNVKGQWRSLRIPTPAELQCVLFVPRTTVETKGSRAVMPTTFDRDTVIHQMSRSMLLDAAFRGGDLSLLKDALDDQMHQPHRTGQNPHLFPLIEAAYEAGAVGAYLSGSGPTVMALTAGGVGDIFTQREGERAEHAVADAMVKAAAAMDVAGVAKVTTPAAHGAHVLEARPAFSTDSILHFPSSPMSPV